MRTVPKGSVTERRGAASAAQAPVEGDLAMRQGGKASLIDARRIAEEAVVEIDASVRKPDELANPCQPELPQSCSPGIIAAPPEHGWHRVLCTDGSGRVARGAWPAEGSGHAGAVTTEHPALPSLDIHDWSSQQIDQAKLQSVGLRQTSTAAPASRHVSRPG
jgi:hypothetical protein